jgi:hypothetical protein
MSTREKFPEFSHLVLPQKAQEQLQKMSAELRRRQESLLSHPFFAEGKGFLKFFWDIPSKKGGRPKSVAAKHHTELGAFERQINRKFTLDGAIKSVSDPKTGPYASFFEVHGRSTIIRGKYILRGARYSTAIDAGHDETQRYDNYFQDFVDGLSVLTAEQKKIETEAHFFEKQAVLDYVKNASVSLLNALMADERDGNFPEDETALTHYLDTRKSLEDIARSSVFAQYAHLAGDKETLDKELTTLFKKVTTLKKAIGVLRSLHKKDPYKRRTGVRELTHPLHIAGAALHTVTTGATRLPETILGLPTGSTEYAYALQYAFEHLEQRRPNVILAPLSLHNARKVSATTNTMKALGDPALAVFLKHYRRNIDGKNLLVVDDNSSSGETLDTIKQTLANFFNPKHIEASVAQVDTRRGEHLAQRAVRKPTKDAHLRVSTPESLKMSVSNLHMSRVLKKKCATERSTLWSKNERESECVL